MNRPTRACLALVALVVGGTPAQAQERISLGEEQLRELDIPPLEWSVPQVGKEVTRFVLDNGAVVYVYPDHRVPLVTITFRFRAGTFYEPVDRAGLSNMTLNLLRTGGTTLHSDREIDEELDFLAAEITTNPGDEACDLSLDVLTKDLDRGLTLLAEMVRTPAFPDDRIRFRKEEVKSSIRRANDNPRNAAGREFAELVYGDHPYGRAPRWDRIRMLSREDLVDFHARHYHPGNLFIAVTGDLDPTEAQQRLEAVLDGWESGPAPTVRETRITPGAEEGSLVLYQKDLTQTAIVFGRPALDRNSPDIYAAQVLNYVLGGGGFASRLTQRVRDRAGLAYNVNSSLPTGRRDAGPLTVQSQTKTETTVEALTMMRDIMAEMAVEPIPPGEFDGARNAILNGFVRGLANTATVVQALLDLEFEDRPRDYYTTYLDRIRAVTPEQVQQLARRLYALDSMVTVLVGNVSRFESELSRFGPTEVRELPEQELD